MKSCLIRTQDLSRVDLENMYSLFNTHFAGVKPNVFDADLANKNWVILLKDKKTDQLQGFSTLLFYQTKFKGENFSVVYSGDTIIDPSAWSSSILSRAWISSVKKLHDEYGQGKLYWLLISSGYRTYRFLPVFWQEFYPRYDQPTPEHISELMEFLAGDRFGKSYNQQTGIVSFPYPQVLQEGLQGIPPERLQDPDIQYFQLRNPGHLQGDELVCLTEISEQNLTRAGRRMWFADVSVTEVCKAELVCAAMFS